MIAHRPFPGFRMDYQSCRNVTLSLPPSGDASAAAGPKLAGILDPDAPDKYTLTYHLWNYSQNNVKKHQAAGNCLRRVRRIRASVRLI